MDGLPMFIDKTWEIIKSQKDINLPDQRIMVANLRCNELRDEAIQKVLSDIERLKAQSEKGYVQDFD